MVAKDIIMAAKGLIEDLYLVVQFISKQGCSIINQLNGCKIYNSSHVKSIGFIPFRDNIIGRKNKLQGISISTETTGYSWKDKVDDNHDTKS